MWNFSTSFSLFAIFSIFISTIVAQAVVNLPQCVSNCIDSSTDATCSLSDTKCICRASNGNFLSDLVTCVHSTCDYTLDTTLWIEALQVLCLLAGTPIGQQAINNAENLGSSLSNGATTVVVTVTESPQPVPIVSTYTRTGTISGSAVVIVYPSTLGFSTGSPVTATISAVEPVSSVGVSSAATTAMSTSAIATTATDFVSVIVVSTNSKGSAFSITTTAPETVRTVTSTKTIGSTKTVVSTYTTTYAILRGSSSGSSSLLSTSKATGSSPISAFPTITTSSGFESPEVARSTILSTSVAGQETTGSVQSYPSGAEQPTATNTDSAPLGMQPGGGPRQVPGCLWLVVVLGGAAFAVLL